MNKYWINCEDNNEVTIRSDNITFPVAAICKSDTSKNAIIFAQQLIKELYSGKIIPSGAVKRYYYDKK